MSDVAVVIPVRDGAAFLGAALDSVLGQTHPPTEIVVVDDGSTDESARVAEAFAGVRVHRQPPTGQSVARNVGVALTSAPHVAFLDADDLMPPDRLAVQSATLDDLATAAGCIGQVVTFTADDPTGHGEAEPGPLMGALMVRRTCFDRVGGFDPALRAGEYPDWLLRVRDAGLEVVSCDEVVLWRRAHGTNLTRNADATAAAFLQVAHRAIERAREKGRRRPDDR